MREERIEIGKIGARPNWIRARAGTRENFFKVRDTLEEFDLKSVCVSAECPNKGECWEKKHVTFLILGSACTRNCLFCNVSQFPPEAPNPEEPKKVAGAVKKLGIEYAVLTSPTRDDLDDKGAGHFLRTVEEIKKFVPSVSVELLIPDFGADEKLLRRVALSGAVVVGHNIEMPRRLYPRVRPASNYDMSLKTLGVLSAMKKEGAKILVKSSIILGLGENDEDIFETLVDLKAVNVDVVYIGQYLSPSKDHWRVEKYYTPEEFEYLGQKAREMGFRAVRSGAMVRSSYEASHAR